MFADKLHATMRGGGEVAEPLSRNEGKGTHDWVLIPRFVRTEVQNIAPKVLILAKCESEPGRGVRVLFLSLTDYQRQENAIIRVLQAL
jgi:hypothetical protein